MLEQHQAEGRGPEREFIIEIAELGLGVINLFKVLHSNRPRCPAWSDAKSVSQRAPSDCHKPKGSHPQISQIRRSLAIRGWPRAICRITTRTQRHEETIGICTGVTTNCAFGCLRAFVSSWLLLTKR